MTEFTALLHVSMLVSDLPRARAFYEGVLGLSPSPSRPEMSFAGIWYDVGVGQIHLMCLPSPYARCELPVHGGRDRHAAFAVRGWDELRLRLLETGVAFTLSQSGRAAMFVRDPEGNTLELVPAITK